jgi:predicted heme/steroid binding protein
MLLPPSRAKATSCNPRNMIPNPASLIKGKQELPEVDQLETISLETLNQYHCDNPDRRLVSLFGTVYDVTSSENSYGSDGAYKEYAGHDVTLALSMHKTQEEYVEEVKIDLSVTSVREAHFRLKDCAQLTLLQQSSVASLDGWIALCK